MVFNIVKCLSVFSFLLLFNHSHAQYKNCRMLALIKKNSSEVALIKKGKRVEVVMAKKNKEGKVKFIDENKILIEDQWISLDEILIIVDPNEKIKVQDMLAWPLMGSGVLVGIVGLAMTASPLDDGFDDSEATTSMIGGLLMMGIGTGLTYGGIKLKSKRTVSNDIFYSPKTHNFIVMERKRAKEMKSIDR